MEKNITLTIFPVEMKLYVSEYAEKLKTGMFKESIRINNSTCVYRRWESTQISCESMPMARFPILQQ